MTREVQQYERGEIPMRPSAAGDIYKTVETSVMGVGQGVGEAADERVRVVRHGPDPLSIVHDPPIL